MSLPVFAQNTDYPPELQALVDKKQRAISEVNKTFSVELEKLKSKFTQQGRLDEALKVDGLLKIHASDTLNTKAYLDDMQGFNIKVGHGQLGTHGMDGDKRQILVNGTIPKHSVFLHPPSHGSSTVSYRLNRGYSIFQGKVTLVDNATPRTPLVYRILADNVPVWESKKIQSPKDGQDFSIDIKGKTILTLEVMCQGAFNNAWAVWVDPGLQ